MSWLGSPYHWEGDKRICNKCGNEILIFSEGYICSGKDCDVEGDEDE